MQLTVNVTQEHINKGQAGICNRCPIALAMFYAGFFAAHVEEDFAYGIYNNKEYSISLPEEATNFISNFDNEDLLSYPVVPFSFSINLE